MALSPKDRISDLVMSIYGRDQHASILANITQIIENYQATNQRSSQPVSSLSEHDAILITYGDQFLEQKRAPLSSLLTFLQRRIGRALTGVHILPFYPYSSDDGFSVIDFYAVDPELGGWQEISEIGKQYKLMVDFVVNHVSSQSDWFRRFIDGDPHFMDYFIAVDPKTDITQVVRPRALPLLTPVHTALGKKHVWTTFSDDQIDLNFANPAVLIEMIKVLLFYIAKGADIVRLDAIAYLWKEVGHPCIHHPKTHLIVKLMRAIVDEVAPDVLFITETNVPHEENIAYFGNPLPEYAVPDYLRGRSDEAQMVYQFPLAPLTIHALTQGDASKISAWAASLKPPHRGTTFFNFIASHDGIGVRPAEGILTQSEITMLAERAITHGGKVSYKNNPDGTQSPYELNITLYDLLNPPDETPTSLHIDRFMASQAIMLSLVGVPGIYIHSLFGSSNCYTCLDETNRARSLNREKFNYAELSALLDDPTTRAHQIFNRYLHLLKIRQSLPQFNPASGQAVLSINQRVFCLLRRENRGSPYLIFIVNVTSQPVYIELPSNDLPGKMHLEYRDAITGNRYSPIRDAFPIELAPYQYLWLQPEPQ